MSSLNRSKSYPNGQSNDGNVLLLMFSKGNYKIKK